ncbi:hypothetical protein K3169_03265 [Pseudomonas phytophila]|uniref:Uncharacterized protein n=1 Tax=Pseudomonas phytophila TaxID=2867264 RepID=A0ABY6FGA4_9PSED|nr:hypothetical protein [Pseudomonas phytophila]UXZ96947.1 hypothetical protein K3169_03265 [Pseudomonas phytophila]
MDTNALDLTAPEVPEAIRQGNPNRLDFYRMAEGTDLIMRVYYKGMNRGHSIRGRWVGRVEYTTDIKYVTLVGPMDFIIPRDEVIDSIGMSVNVNYSVVEDPNNPHSPLLPSKALALTVEPQGISLLAPTISADNRTVSVNYGSQSNDTVAVRWKGRSEYFTEIKNPPAGGGVVTFSIPPDWVAENTGREVLINYSVGRGGAGLRFSQILRRDIP